MTVKAEASFGGRLRRLRQAAGLSQEALAERAGLTAAAIGALERGERRHPYPHTLHALASALGLSDGEREALFMSVPRRGAGGSRETATEAAGAPRPLQPPSPLTPIVGRERDIDIVTGLLQRGGARMVTLTGPPGVGKTRLGIEVARLVGDSFEAGAVWVDLAPVSEVDLVPATIARALGLQEAAGLLVSEALESYLARRHALLVLDNFEHLLAAAPSVAALLERCPRLSALVTSREALRLRGEHVVEVPPLGVPDAGPDGAAKGVEDSEAVALFVQRAGAAVPGFDLSDGDAPRVAAICARLDGIPLALELAAAQLRYMSPAALLARLEGGVGLPEGAPRDLPARQRSLRAAIDWSHRLLNAPEQELFRRLAVFAGGFTQEAAHAVCSGDGPATGDRLRVLTALVDKSLVQARPDPNGETRFSMLETVREFAAERLVESGERVALATRHAGYFSELAQSAEPHLTSGSREVWLRQLDIEAANLRAALAWSASGGDPCAGLRLAGVLGWFWIMRGYVAEASRWAAFFLRRETEACEAGDRAGALYAAAALAWKRGEHATARRYAEESVALRRALGDARRLALSLAMAGLVATSQGDLKVARALHEEALSLSRERDDDWGIAYALSNLGDALLQKGDLATARRLYDEGLERFTKADDAWGRAIVLHALGAIAWAEGDAAAARDRYGASVALCRTIGNSENLARGLLGLAAATLREVEPDDAERQLMESLAIWRDFGSSAGVAVCLAGLASVQAARGRYREAARLFGGAKARSEGQVFLVDPELFSEWLEETRDGLGEAAFTEAGTPGAPATVDELLAGVGGGKAGGTAARR